MTQNAGYYVISKIISFIRCIWVKTCSELLGIFFAYSSVGVEVHGSKVIRNTWL